MSRFTSIQKRISFLRWCYASGTCKKKPKAKNQPVKQKKTITQVGVEAYPSENIETPAKDKYLSDRHRRIEAKKLQEWLEQQPYEVREQFEKEMGGIFFDGANGEHLLFKKVGFKNVQDKGIFLGSWEGHINPGRQLSVDVKTQIGEDGLEYIKSSDKEKINAVSAIIGKVLVQDGVGYNKPFITKHMEKANGVLLDIGRPLTPKEFLDLQKIVPDQTLIDDINKMGVKIIDFNFKDNYTSMQKSLDKKLHKFTESIKENAHLVAFRTDGDLVTNFDSFKYDDKNYNKIYKRSNYGNSKQNTNERRSSNAFRGLIDHYNRKASKIRQKWLKKVKADRFKKLKEARKKR